MVHQGATAPRKQRLVSCGRDEATLFFARRTCPFLVTSCPGIGPEAVRQILERLVEVGTARASLVYCHADFAL